MSDQRNVERAVLAAVLFLLSYVSLRLVGKIPGYSAFFRGLPEIYWWIENAVRPLIPVLLGLSVAYGLKPARWARELGFDRPALPAFVLALVITSPLYLVPLAIGAPTAAGGWVHQLFASGIWPLEEETVFRGYAFGQIYQYSGLGFWPAGILTSLLFGLGHMANAAAAGMDLAGQLANAGFVGLSALVLAWLYARWNRNIWVVFFLHGLGNFWGDYFRLGDTAVSSKLFMALLIVTLLLGVGATIFRNKLPWFKRLAA